MSNTELVKDIIIIGGIACGPKTAATLARRLPEAKITVFQKDDYVSFDTCGLLYFASGDIPGIEALKAAGYGVERTPEFFKNSKGFEIIPSAEVLSIDRGRKTISVKMPETGATLKKKYDKLVLATGAARNQPPFSVPACDRIGHFTCPGDAEKFRRLAEQGRISKALIIGGGSIGCQLSGATGSLWGIETVLVEKESHLLPCVLDPEMAAIVERELTRQGVEVITGAEVKKIELTDSDNPVTYINGRKAIEVDYVFLCLGVTPEIKLARECGLEIGGTGGIVIDSHLRTSDPDIYAGGDCVESLNLVSGKKFYLTMGSLANRHGRVIAENIAGDETEFKGALGAFFAKVYDLNIGAVGLSQRAAGQAGIESDAVWGSFPDRAEYYPEAENITVKLVFDPDTEKVLGLQAVGKGEICRRIDVGSALMQKGAGLNDMLDFEHGYAPPYAEALDPLHHLAAMALAKRKGLSFINPGEDFAVLGNDIIWLDVREPAESESQPWPYGSRSGGSRLVCIPLNDLKNRLNELDDRKKIIIICTRGPRSYQAVNILRKAGFDDVHTIGGGLRTALL